MKDFKIRMKLKVKNSARWNYHVEANEGQTGGLVCSDPKIVGDVLFSILERPVSFAADNFDISLQVVPFYG